MRNAGEWGPVGGMACEAGGVTPDRGSMGVACKTGKGMLESGALGQGLQCGALGQGLQCGSGGDCPGVLSPWQAGSHFRARDVLIAQAVLLFEGPRGGGVPIPTQFLAFANLTLGSTNLNLNI